MQGSNIASAINAAHAGVEAAKREGARYAVECGNLLIQAKVTVPHGTWDAWLREKTKVSPRSAQLYMRIARHVEGDPAKAQRVAGLSLREAAKEAAQPSAPKREQKPFTPEQQAQLDELLHWWNEGRPEWRELFAREIYDRGDITREERDRWIAAAYRGLSDDDRSKAGDGLARFILQGRKGIDGRTLTGVLQQYAGEAPAIAIADAVLSKRQ